MNPEDLPNYVVDSYEADIAERQERIDAAVAYLESLTSSPLKRKVLELLTGSPTPELDPITCFWVGGRGLAYVVKVPEEGLRLGDRVRLNGDVVEVVGVEMPPRDGVTAIMVR